MKELNTRAVEYKSVAPSVSMVQIGSFESSPPSAFSVRLPGVPVDTKGQLQLTTPAVFPELFSLPSRSMPITTPTLWQLLLRFAGFLPQLPTFVQCYSRNAFGNDSTPLGCPSCGPLLFRNSIRTFSSPSF